MAFVFFGFIHSFSPTTNPKQCVQFFEDQFIMATVDLDSRGNPVDKIKLQSLVCYRRQDEPKGTSTKQAQ